MIGIVGRGIIAIILTGIMSYFSLGMDKQVIQALYTVLGIGFSIAISNIISFNLSEVASEYHRNEFINKLRTQRNKHGVDFFLSTSLYIICSSTPQSIYELFGISFNWLTLSGLYILLSLVDLLFGFISIQKLNEDVAKRIITEKRNQKKL